MPKYITRRQAEACLKIVREHFGTDEPDLYEPGHEGPFWNISMEGYGDWAIDIASNENITWPRGVFAEPVASWCLGLHRA